MREFFCCAAVNSSLMAGSLAQAQLQDGLYGLSPAGGPTPHTDLLLIDPGDASFSVVATFDVELDSFDIPPPA